MAWDDTVVDHEVIDVAGDGLDSVVEERPMAVVTWLVDRLLEGGSNVSSDTDLEAREVVIELV